MGSVSLGNIGALDANTEVMFSFYNSLVLPRLHSLYRIQISILKFPARFRTTLAFPPRSCRTELGPCQVANSFSLGRMPCIFGETGQPEATLVWEGRVLVHYRFTCLASSFSQLYALYQFNRLLLYDNEPSYSSYTNPTTFTALILILILILCILLMWRIGKLARIV
ncbi:hypothetical protein KQX54_018117 [Cotesia glomerata]|uniref:Uncharacterized protein n=1 Tax=Cotesia glomerata TaxID=32391 RepID=A0AAV7I1X4_COTGL|nr:hypothetical protein KQX54_018117 [Cotesia glomerata]